MRDVSSRTCSIRSLKSCSEISKSSLYDAAPLCAKGKRFSPVFSRGTIVNTDFKNLQSLKIMRLSVTQSVYPVCGRWRERGGPAGEILLPIASKPNVLACTGGRLIEFIQKRFPLLLVQEINLMSLLALAYLCGLLSRPTLT